MRNVTFTELTFHGDRACAATLCKERLYKKKFHDNQTQGLVTSTKSQTEGRTRTPHKVSFYKVVQIWPGLFVCKQVTVCPGHIWTTLYFVNKAYKACQSVTLTDTAGHMPWMPWEKADRGGCLTPRPDRFIPGRTRYPFYTRLGGFQGWPGRVRKNVAPTGIRFPMRPARSDSLHWLSYPGPI